MTYLHAPWNEGPTSDALLLPPSYYSILAHFSPAPEMKPGSYGAGER